MFILSAKCREYIGLFFLSEQGAFRLHISITKLTTSLFGLLNLIFASYSATSVFSIDVLEAKITRFCGDIQALLSTFISIWYPTVFGPPWLLWLVLFIQNVDRDFIYLVYTYNFTFKVHLHKCWTRMFFWKLVNPPPHVNQPLRSGGICSHLKPWATILDADLWDE